MSFSVRSRHPRVAAVLLTVVLAFTACQDTSITDEVPAVPELAGGTVTEVTVTGATPPAAPQDTTLNVEIAGTGFDRGSVAAFEINGVPDPKVRVNSTKFTRSTLLVANVTIAIDAVTAAYDIAVTTTKGKKGIGTELFAVTEAPVTATWLIPLADGSLGVRSDRQFGDGTYSVYAHGVCGVETGIAATASGSNSGDATFRTNKKSCTRRWALHFPDGFTESVRTFNNLNILQNTSYSIPVGTTAKRRLIIAPGVFGSNPSRCGRLIYGPNGTVSPGSDSLEVTRVDPQTWQVRSQAAPNNRAYCENNGQLYTMPLDLVIVSNVPLP
jgi:hypothetical protein